MRHPTLHSQAKFFTQPAEGLLARIQFAAAAPDFRGIRQLLIHRGQPFKERFLLRQESLALAGKLQFRIIFLLEQRSVAQLPDSCGVPFALAPL